MQQQKHDIVATIGHEFRTPLMAVGVAAAVLRMRNAADPGALHAVEIIERQCQIMTRLVDDVLDMARLDSGKLQLKRCVIDVRTIVAETVETHRPQLERRQHALKVTLGDDPVIVDADPIRIAQVVSNLVDNAAKYTPEHGTITVGVSAEGEEAVLAVRDTGAGIPPTEAPTIFEQFTQLPETRTAANGGLGLGLALVKSLTELHGGMVKVVSEGAGRGSCFTVRLPRRSSPSPSAAHVA